MPSHGTVSLLSVDQFRAFASAVLNQLPPDIDPTTAQEWIRHQKALRKALREVLLPPDHNLFQVSVDYNLSLEEMISAGRYERVSRAIELGDFQSTVRGEVEVAIELVHFGRGTVTFGVLQELDEKMGLRPAEPTELLALGVEYPELQTRFPIAALSSIQGGKYALTLEYQTWSDGPARVLDVHPFYGTWESDWRFAAVRK